MRLLAAAASIAVFTALPALAAEPATAPTKKVGWFNSTELSVVYTDGNSSTQTYGFKDTLRREWEKGRFRLKLDYVRSDTADDEYLLVAPGITFLPGETPDDAALTLIVPPVEPDTEKIFVEGMYAREITKRFFWSAGASWDRNEDAGILDRYIGFGTLGNRWFLADDLSWATSYGLSYTDRQEEFTEPDRATTFLGVRVGSDLIMKMGTISTFENDLTANFNSEDFADYSFDLTSSVSVVMGKHVSLKVSLQYLFNSEPALQDVDVIARVVLENPDGIPGSGDEYFRTVSSGGSEITLREDQIHKEPLDTVFRTTLVINF